VGQVVLSSGGKAIAGRVVSSAPAASGGNDVVFATAGLAEIFDLAKIVTRFEGAQLPLQFPNGAPVSETVQPNGEVARLFRVSVPASAPVRTTATSATGKGGKTAGVVSDQVRPAADFNVGPLRCKSNGSVSANFGGTSVNVTPVGSLGVVESTLIVDGGAAYAKVLAEGNFGVQLQGSLRVSGQLNGDVKCGVTLVQVPIPVPPQVALIVQPVVPLGFRFAVAGQLNSPGLEIKVDSSVRQPIRAGFELQPNGTLENLSSLDSTQQQTSFDWDLQADPDAPGFSFEAEARAGLFADAALTNPFLTAAAPVLGIDPNLRLLEGFAGFNSVARLKPVAAQMANTAQPALYNIRFRASVGTSDTINRALALIGAAVGASSIPQPEVKWEPTLFTSPTGGGIASLRKFEAGDRVTFNVLLAPDSVKGTFLGQEILPYNVKRVEVWRKEGGGGATRVASVDAATGRTEFSREWSADQSGELDSKYYAFVVPQVGQSFPLLLGEVLGWRGVVQIGANQRDEARGFGWDDKGRVYVAMTTPAGLGYRDPGTGARVDLPQYGGWDTQILRYNPIGSVTGGLSFGGPGDDVPMQMRRAPDGALYAVGNSAAGSQTGDPVNGFQSAWIAKIDVSGVAPRLVWRRQIGIRNEFAWGMDIGEDGSVYLASILSGSRANVGGSAFDQQCGDVLAGRGTADHPDDCGDIVVTRMSPDGDVLWRNVDLRPGWQTAPSIAVRGNTAFVVSHTYCEIEDASVDGQRGPCVTNEWRNPDDSRFYAMTMIGVTRIGTAGGAFTRLKSIKIAASGPLPPDDRMSVFSYALTLDSGGRPIIGGQLRRAESGYVQRTNALPYFLMGLNAAGEPAWTRIYGDPMTGQTSPAPRGFVAAPDGGFYATFASTGSLFSGSAGGRDVMVLKLGPDGSEQWGRQFGSAGDERAQGIDVDTYGNVFVYGSTTGGFGRGMPVSGGDRDAFWLKLSVRGEIQSNRGPVVRKSSVPRLPRVSIP
jgi:hypothetical protein